ncbi:DUF4190 domain-containing protein [Pseudactinotalea sp.]|uniref:DUF4190 domain-containing protein n=1 Tax=Pseudactinotalea sp. TaxID=1926260 RepID=UPI003B3BDA6F
MGQPPASWPSPDQPPYGQPAGAPASPTPGYGQQGSQQAWQDPSGAPQGPPVPQIPQMPTHQGATAPSGQSMYGARPAEQPVQQQGGYGSFTFPVAPKHKLEPLAVAGVATSPLGPVGIALGLLARNRIKQTRRRSMNLAWTGVALGALFTVGWALLTAVLSLNGTIDRALESPQPGNVSSPRTIAAANLAVGNCIQTLPPAQQVGEVRLVPCAEEHAAQVVSLHALSGQFPGADQLATDATSTCTADVEQLDAGDASFVPWYLVPSEIGWDQGNTQVVCLLRADAGPLDVDLVNS